MNKRVLIIFIALMAMFLSFNLNAQNLKPILQEVYDIGGMFPDNVIYPAAGSIQYSVWFVARPGDVQYGPTGANSAGMDQGRFLLQFNLGNFNQAWTGGEILRIEVLQHTTGFVAETEFAIIGGTSPQARFDAFSMVLQIPPAFVFDSRPPVLDEIITSATVMAGYPEEGVYRANNWELEDYWQITFSTEGVEDLAVASQLRRASYFDEEIYFDDIMGPRRFHTYYSIDDGATWIQYPVLDWELPIDESWFAIDFDLPEECADLAEVQVRWVYYDSNGSTVPLYPVEAWGEIKDVVVTGMYLPSPNPNFAVQPSPANGTTGLDIGLEHLGWVYNSQPTYTDPVGFRVYLNDTGEFSIDDPYVWVDYIDGESAYTNSEILEGGLEYSTTYYWQVVPTTDYPAPISNIGRGDAENVPVWTFSTLEPWTEFAEYFTGVTPPALPAGWSSIVESTETTAFVRTWAAGTGANSPISPPNQIQMATGPDHLLDLMLISPLVTNFDENFLKFWAKISIGSRSGDVVVGVMSDPADADTFVAVETINIPLNSVYTQYGVFFPETIAAGHIAFKLEADLNFTTLLMDDLVWMVVPDVYNPPQNLVGEAGYGYVNLSWDAPMENTLRGEISSRRGTTGTREMNRFLMGYNLYRDGVMINEDLLTATSYQDTDVIPEATYDYYVTAVYFYGESGPSNTVEVTLPAVVLNPPLNLTAEAGDAIVWLAWDAPEPPPVALAGRNTRMTAQRDSNTRLELEGYNVYRNNVMINTALVTAMEYEDTNVVNDVTYFYYVTAVYDAGESEPSNSAEATPAFSNYPPTDLTAMAGNGYVDLAWQAPDGTAIPDMVMLRQHSNTPEDGYYQQYNSGYGVVFDLATYPGATLEYIEFRHSPWGVFGTFQYKVHIVNWTTFATIQTIGPLSTTLNNGWELEVDLGSVAGTNGLVGVLIEPMSNSPTDAYPCIDTDGTLNGYSVLAPVADWSDYSTSTGAGDFLIDLWIQPTSRTEVVQAQRVIQVPNTGNDHLTRLNRTGLIQSSNLYMTQNAYTRELTGYNIYRDNAVLDNVSFTVTDYRDNDVVNGTTYEYYVTAVYDTGESDPSNTVSATPNAPIILPPTNLTASLEGTNVRLNWEAPEFGEWIHWDDGIFSANSIGTGAAAQFRVAVRFSPDNLEDLEVGGRYLTAIRFVPAQVNCVYTLNVWTGGSATAPGDLVVQQLVPTPLIGDWNTVELDDPVYIDAGQELWFGYHVNTQTGHPAGVDAGPGIDGFGNLIYLTEWETLMDYGLNYNWNLQGFASFAPGREAPVLFARDLRSDAVERVAETSAFSGELSVSRVTPGHSTIAPARNSRQGLSGFRIYRDGMSIAETEADITTYLDVDLDPGVYEYYVTALYDEEESEPSNTVMVNTNVSAILFDDFESYPDFALQFAPWTLIDLDQSTTYGFSNVTFPNEEMPMAYIIFNPSETTPPLEYSPYSGDKMAASFAATNPPNNDWMITPRLELGSNSTLSFWARSYTAQYGLERLRVGVSATSMAPNTFTIISETPYIEVPTTWTQFTFDISNWDDGNVWIGLNCVSDDAFILFIDDFLVQGMVSADEDDVLTPLVTRLTGNYPNPFNPETTIAFDLQQAGPVSIEIFNIKGQKVTTLVDEFMESGTHRVVWNGKNSSNRDAGSGIYFYRMKSGSYSATKKMILMK